MAKEMIETDVLIVGAGPTGLTLANVLGNSKVSTLLIERKESTIGEPRAVSIDDESLRTMQAIGLANAVLKNVVTGYGVHYLSKPSGRCFAKVEPSASDYGYPRRNAFRQPLLEASLREGLKRFDTVDIRFSHIMESFTQDAEGVTANIRRSTGESLVVRARYMVGADGGRSPTREALGQTMVGSTFKSRWLVIDTEDDDDPFWQTRVYCDARRPIVDVPGPHRTRRYEILVHPGEDADVTMQAARVEELLWPLRQGRPTNIIRKVVYTFHARMAEHWRVHRIFLAGDAAHLTPPYAGQGLNSGIRDAHNLGWKLAARCDGILSDAALDSYEQERRPHAWALIRMALNLGIVMAPRTRFHAWIAQAFFTTIGYIPPLRDYFLQMKFKPKPLYRKGLLGPESFPGTRGKMFPQPIVRTKAGTEILLDELIGNHFSLISYHSSTINAPLKLSDPLWHRIGAVRIIIYSATFTFDALPLPENTIVVIDSKDALREQYASRQGQILLVRPDRYVAGSFHAAAETNFARTFGIALGLCEAQLIPEKSQSYR